MKVNFLIAGVQKAGTSAMDYYLRQHPEIGMAKRKELHFFDNEELFQQSNIDYGILENKFEIKPDQRIYGESTQYTATGSPVCEESGNITLE